MRRVRTSSSVLLLLVGVLAACAGAFHAPQPLRRQNAMRMMAHKKEYQPNHRPFLAPPGDDDLEGLERRLPPAIATLLRLASTVAIASAYLISPVMAPRPAEAVVTSSTVTLADRSVMEATCLGFGCGSYNGVDFDGAAKPDEPNIDMPSFLKAVDEKRVVEVELLDGGNIAYATVRQASSADNADGASTTARLRIGEGFPVENGKSWSSPLWVVRILKDKQIPYTLKFDFAGAATASSKPPTF